jgi:mRNA-degrading endonuclease toxin of MazEF toxin-antitoxin module
MRDCEIVRSHFSVSLCVIIHVKKQKPALVGLAQAMQTVPTTCKILAEAIETLPTACGIRADAIEMVLNLILFHFILFVWYELQF